MAARASADVLEIKKYLLRHAVALGNSEREEKDVCSELLNNYIRTEKEMAEVCEGTFLCSQTIRRLMDLKETPLGNPYNPSSDTCARVLRFFNMEAKYTSVKIQPKYRNKPKVAE